MGLGALQVIPALQGVAEEEMGVGLAEAITGLAVDSQRLSSVNERPVDVTKIEMDSSQSGQRLALKHPELGLAGKDQSLLRSNDRLFVLTEMPARDRQADEGLRLGVAVAGRHRHRQRLLMIVRSF